MAGFFELFTDDEGCKVRILDGRGKELAVSAPFSDRRSAVRGINAFREIAASAVIVDHTASAPRDQTTMS